MKIGICSVCGCTETNACVDVDYGACWWTDDEETLCSHCAPPSNPNSLFRLIEEEIIDNEE